MAPSRYQVRVTKDYLVFCAGHFITYDGDHCERVHGHNYRVAVEVEDALDQNAYVVDFIALKDMTLALVNELDHRMLLPTTNPRITLEDDGPNVKASYKGRYWSFPRDECVLLPIANTTAELLAEYLGTRLCPSLERIMGRMPQVLRVEVEECFGQSARVEWQRG